MKGVVMLADFAEAVNGKLYIMGGGWSQIQASPQGTVNFGIAAKLFVAWTEANHKHTVKFVLHDEDGHVVEPAEGQPFELESIFEVGRPPGLRPGTDIDAPMAFNIAGLPLSKGRYTLQLDVGGELLDSVTFDVN